MSRLFTEFYFKDQVYYPDHPPTSNTDISNYASDIKKLASAIDRAGWVDDYWVDVLKDISKEADNIYSNVDGIIGGEHYQNYSQELEEILETQLTGLWDLEDLLEEMQNTIALDQLRWSNSYKPRYRSSQAILNDYIFRYTRDLFLAFPDANFCVDLNKYSVITEKETNTNFKVEEWSGTLRIVPPSQQELRSFQDYYNPTFNEIVLFELTFGKEYPLKKMVEVYKPELLKQNNCM